MRGSDPRALRFVLVASSVTLAVVAQELIRGGSFKWAVAPLVVALAAMILSVARRPLSAFDRPARPTPGPASAQSRLPLSASEYDVPGLVAASFGVRGLLHRWTRGARRELAVGVGTIVASGVLLGVSLVQFGQRQAESRTVAWYAFGVAVVALLLAIPALEGRWSALLRRVRSGLTLRLSPAAVAPWTVLGAVLVLGLLLRLYQLDQLPAGLWYDEADNLFQARQIAADPGNTPIYVPSTNLPSLFLLPIALVVKLAGVAITTGRLVSVAFGLAGIVAVFLFVRLAMGARAGLVAALLVSVMRWDINWSRIGMHGITAPLFAALTAYLTLRALKSGSFSGYGLAGASLGLGMWFYTSLRLFPLVVAFMLLHHLVVQRPGVRRLAAQAAVMAAVSLFVAAPVVLTAVQDSDQFFSRTQVTSIFNIVPRDQVAGQIKSSLVKHALMFNEQGDPNPRHNLPHVPMLDFLTGTLMLLGLGIALWRWRDVALVSLPFWIFVMLLPGVMTVPSEAPQSLRSIAVVPAVAALASLAVVVIWRAGSEAPWRWVSRATTPFVLALLGMIAFANVDTYFGAQASDPRVFAAFSTDETLMSRHMTEQQRQGYSLWVSRQFLFGLTSTLLASQPRLEVIKAPETIPLDSTGLWRGASIYLEPRESGFYDTLREYYPDGQFMAVRAPGGGEPLYYSAVISREQLAARQGLEATYRLADGSLADQLDVTDDAVWRADQGPARLPYELVWQGSLHFQLPGEYRFRLAGDTDAVVEIDHRTVLTSANEDVTVVPAVGLHSLSIRAMIDDPGDFISLSWQPPGEALEPVPFSNLYHGSVRPVGLAGRFFEGREEKDVPDAVHTTPATDNFYYQPVVPVPSLAVWTGSLRIEQSGVHTFQLDGAGRVELTIDGSQVALKPAGEGSSTREVPLNAGVRHIRVEYRTNAPSSEIKVLWAPPGLPLRPIPQDLMTPAWEHLIRAVD
jgi:4-amino-4-deoxy-L-arabinose transferase-like glycosyltransferase